MAKSTDEQAFSSLKRYFLRVIIVIYIISSLVVLSVVYFTLDNKIYQLGSKFATQYAVKEKNRLLAPIQREVALAKKLIDTPTLIEWVENEADPKIKAKGLAELESYRRHFQDRSYFFIIDKSKNYYFNNADNEYAGEQYRYTLQADEPADQWYFSTMQNVDDFDLNVNVDTTLGVTKLWINVIIYNQEGEKVGLAGTGLTLNRFIEEFLKNDSELVTPIIFDHEGAIQAFSELSLIQMTSLEDSTDNTIFKLLPRKEDQAQISETIQHLTIEEDAVQITSVQFDGREKIAAIVVIPEIKWYVMILFDTAEILSFSEFLGVFGILFIALLSIILAIVFFSNTKIIAPIRDLTTFAERISVGQFNERVHIDADNELGKLAASLNEMAETIGQHTDNLESLVEQRTSELSATNLKLEEQNKKIMDNITYAKYIQNSILPLNQDLRDEFEEHFVIWRPRDTVGGDFYWFKKVGQVSLIAIVDCTGHGVSGALMAMTANAILNRIIDTERITDPAEILQKLNIMLKDTLHRDDYDPGIDDGLDIGLCAIDKESQKLIFAGAKISLFYIESDAVKRISGCRRSIGYQNSLSNEDFTNHELTYDDTVFYMTTDGFLDQNGGEEGKRFGRKQFMDILAEHYSKDLGSQKEIYEQILDSFMIKVEQRDDILVLGFRI